MKHFSYHFLKIVKEIEQRPAWVGELFSKEISLFLAHQKPFTYILSKSPEEGYFLSYVKNHNQGVTHIHFEQVLIVNDNIIKYGYRNVCNITFSTLEAFIRFKIKGKGILPESFPAECSA